MDGVVGAARGVLCVYNVSKREEKRRNVRRGNDLCIVCLEPPFLVFNKIFIVDYGFHRMSLGY